MKILPSRDTIKIAIADDHIMLREGLCILINSWDHCKIIIQADNGRQLIEQINPHNPPDIALIDLKMTGINDYDTICILKKKYPFVKLMAVSSYNSEESIYRSIQAGAEGFIFKGEHPNKFKKALLEMTDTGYYFTNLTALKLIKTGNSTFQNILSEKELRFLEYLSTEQTYKEIADNMKIPERQAEYLRATLFDRFDVQTRTGLVVKAIKKGLIIYKLSQK